MGLKYSKKIKQTQKKCQMYLRGGVQKSVTDPMPRHASPRYGDASSDPATVPLPSEAYSSNVEAIPVARVLPDYDPPLAIAAPPMPKSLEPNAPPVPKSLEPSAPPMPVPKKEKYHVEVDDVGISRILDENNEEPVSTTIISLNLIDTTVRVTICKSMNELLWQKGKSYVLGEFQEWMTPTEFLAALACLRFDRLLDENGPAKIEMTLQLKKFLVKYLSKSDLENRILEAVVWTFPAIDKLEEAIDGGVIGYVQPTYVFTDAQFLALNDRTGEEEKQNWEWSQMICPRKKGPDKTDRLYPEYLLRDHRAYRIK